MPQFAFIAKDRMGNTVQGNIDAPDAAGAASQIGQMGYSLLELRVAPSEANTPTPTPNTPAASAPGPSTGTPNAYPQTQPGLSPANQTLPLPSAAAADPNPSVSRTQAMPHTPASPPGMSANRAQGMAAGTPQFPPVPGDRAQAMPPGATPLSGVADQTRVMSSTQAAGINPSANPTQPMPSTAAAGLDPSANQTQSMPSAAASLNPSVSQTQAMPAGAAPSPGGQSGRTGPPPEPTVAMAPPGDVDLLRADAEKRRKVEADLARMGMRPDEIQRLLNANANTTAPPSLGATQLSALAGTSISPASPAPTSKKQRAQQVVAARAAELQSFAAQLQSANAASRVQAVEAVTLDLPDFRGSTMQERQQAETMLREVYALRRREQYAEALVKCREALALVPSDAAALEMFGDLLQGVARTNEALAAYKRAAEADPKRASAERKYGDLLVRQQQWVEPDTEEVPKNPIAAAAFSLLVPGAGQIHNGQKLKGAILLALAAACMAALLFLMRDKQSYPTSSEKPAPGRSATVREKRVTIDWTAEAPTIACIILYSMLSVGSALDAARVAQQGPR